MDGDGSDDGGGRSQGRQALLWLFTALVATVLLVGVLRFESRRPAPRWSSLPAGDARVGARLYAEKGCARCHDQREHAVRRGAGDRLAGDRMVAAMWNHAPQMWQRARALDVAYPQLTHEELAHLAAFLAADAPAPGAP